MAVPPPIIQLLHASDAPQHTGELKSILDRMKSEKRISDFEALDVSVNSWHTNIKNEDHQGIVVLLTHEIERVRSDIERMLKNLIVDRPNVKLIEIIIDNLPYHNSFISFPQDLMPIRSRDDMNLVWKGIEKDLKAIFPKPPELPKEEKVQKRDPKILLKVLGVSVMTGVLSIICVVYLSDNHLLSPDDVSFLVPMIFSPLLPIIIFFRHRTDFEWFTMSSREQKRVEGAVNWKRLLIATAIAFLVLFLAIWLFSSERDYFEGAAILGVATTLPLLLYRRKTAQNIVPDGAEQIRPQARIYLESLGRYVVFLLLAMVYWWAVLVMLDMDNALPLLFIMPFVTTIGIFVIRLRQKRSRTLF